MAPDNVVDAGGRPPGRPGVPCDEHGGALILVMLILLALSAIGMVALQDVSRSIQQSGNFRARTTAGTFSDSAGQFMVKRIGGKASSIWGAMETFQDFDLDSAGGTLSTRKQLVSQGSAVVFEQDPDNSRQDFGAILNTLNGDETGLFTDGQSTNRSFESREETTRFKIIIRDPVDGIPVPGYSDKYCFKKVTIASQGNVGDVQTDWSRPRQVGVGRNLVEGLMGPIECGSN